MIYVYITIGVILKEVFLNNFIYLRSITDKSKISGFFCQGFKTFINSDNGEWNFD